MFCTRYYRTVPSSVAVICAILRSTAPGFTAPEGMDLAWDTTYIQTGGAPETYLALATGAVDATLITTPQVPKASIN